MFNLCAIHVEVQFFFFFLTCSYVFIAYRSLGVAVLMRLASFFFFFSKSTCDCFGFRDVHQASCFHVKLCVEYDGMSSAVHVSPLVHRKHLGYKFFSSKKTKQNTKPGCDCEVWAFFIFFMFFVLFLLFILYTIKQTWQANSMFMP